MMGNHANKRAAAARHNARYEQRDAVRPNLTKASRFEGKNVGTIGHVDHGVGKIPKRSVWRFLPAILAGLLPKSLIGR